MAPHQRMLTADEQTQAQYAYTVVARWCADLLWQPAGAVALAYLRERGLSDETIRATGLGFHPAAWRDGVGAVLWHRDRQAYEGAQIGGLIGPQGLPKHILRDVITMPYWRNETCTMLRTRKLAPKDGKKYYAPVGVAYYAGGEPTFYLHDVRTQASAVILTEGEFKALAAWQDWRAGNLTMPALATPGVSYLPDPLLDALAGKMVYLCYDAEHRTDPFQFSPGERFTIRHGERMTGADLARRLGQLKLRLSKAKGADGEALLADIDQVTERNTTIQQRGIRVRVVRLPRRPDEMKVDLDIFIRVHGPEALQRLLDTAPDFDTWYDKHAPASFSYARGGIVASGRQIANYRAVVLENVRQHDGTQTVALHRLLTEAPNGKRAPKDVPAAEWADDRKARTVLKAATHDGTSWDEPEVVKAVKVLSLAGDGPSHRDEYLAPGWQLIDRRWHYLMPDGAITGDGPVTTPKALLNERQLGNHYALCGPGDPQRGAAAFREVLMGKQCPQPLALLLAAHAALPLIHRFTGSESRPLLWLHGETGGLKTGLVRATVLALYGPRFTAVRGDGGPVPKWDSTANGLEALVYSYRDGLMLIDDYKLATVKKGTLAHFLHNYSESSNRGRMTEHRTADRSYPARTIVVATGEDLPTGDPGQLGRILLYPLKQGEVNAEALASLQEVGVEGHLAAFWRGFVQELARWLDSRGEAAVRRTIQQWLSQDDEALPGHQRTVGALRQNRAAWLVLCHWLTEAGIISASEAQQLSAAHVDARQRLAREQAQTHQENRPVAIFLNVLKEAVATGEAVILPYVPNGPQSDTRVIGFRHQWGIALYPEKAYRLVSDWRTRQRQPVDYSLIAICQQLDSDRLIARQQRNHRYKMRCGGSMPWMLLLVPHALDLGEDADDEEACSPCSQGDEPDGNVENGIRMGNNEDVPIVPIVPMKDEAIDLTLTVQPHQLKSERDEPIRPASGNNGNNGILAHPNAVNRVPTLGNTTGTGGNNAGGLIGRRLPYEPDLFPPDNLPRPETPAVEVQASMRSIRVPVNVNDRLRRQREAESRTQQD
jgi:hypothetical protein